VSVTAPATATFSVAGTGSPTLAYQWQTSTNGGATWSNVGSNAPSYTTPATNAGANGTRVRVQLTDASSNLVSRVATLTVLTGSVSGVGYCFSNAAGWCYVQPAPQGLALTALAIDGGTGKVYAGGAGTLMASSDNGNSWAIGRDPDQRYWYDLAAPGSGVLVGIARASTSSSSYQRILRSTDGGQTWATALDLTNNVTSLSFADANVGVATGFAILRTTNGGANWSTVTVPASVLPSGMYVGPVAYAGNNTFVAQTYLSGVGGFLRSTDGGLTWAQVNSGTPAAGGYKMAFGGTGFGVAVGRSGFTGTILRTTDYGATWSTVGNGGFADGCADSVGFADANTAVVFGCFSSFIRSTDGGATWSAPNDGLAKQQSGQNFWDVQFANGSLGFAVGNYGAVVRTLDGGQTWARIAGGSLNESISQIETAPGGATVLATNLSGTTPLRSTDAGASWTPVADTFVGLFSWGSANVVMGTYFSTVLLSTDAGRTWTTVRTDPSMSNRLVAMSTPTNAVIFATDINAAAGTGGRAYRTTDAGATWTQAALPNGKAIYTARFLTPLVGLAGGEAGTLFRTTDGGSTWTAVDFQPTRPDVNVQNIGRVSDTVAVIATDTEIKRSTDGGLTWTQTYLTNAGSVLGLAFKDTLNGIAVGVDSILLTADGGQTWTSLSTLSLPVLSTATWANATTPIVAGDGGVILRNTRSGALAASRATALSVRGAPAAQPPVAAPPAPQATKRRAGAPALPNRRGVVAPMPPVATTDALGRPQIQRTVVTEQGPARRTVTPAPGTP
jgi:photosystem II stability/assembly factor-like uncharacterized protein